LRLEDAHGLVGDVQLVASAHEHGKGLLAVAVVARAALDAAHEDLDGGVALRLRGVALEGGTQVRGCDAGSPQGALDALGAPAVEPSAVFREPPRIARVIQIAVGPQPV
jgi:hypothetical protein